MESPCLWRAWWVRLVWFGSCGASTDAATRCLASHGRNLQYMACMLVFLQEQSAKETTHIDINFCDLIRNTSHLIFGWMWGQELGSNWRWAPSFVYFTGTAAPPGSSVCAEIRWNGNLRAPISGQSSGGFSMMKTTWGYLCLCVYINILLLYIYIYLSTSKRNYITKLNNNLYVTSWPSSGGIVFMSLQHTSTVSVFFGVSLGDQTRTWRQQDVLPFTASWARKTH